MNLHNYLKQTKNKVRNAIINYELIQGPHNKTSPINKKGLNLKKGLADENIKIQFSKDGVDWTTIRTYTPDTNLSLFYTGRGDKTSLRTKTDIKSQYRRQEYIHFSEIYPSGRGTSIKNIPIELLEESLDRIIEVVDSGIATVADSNTVHATIRGKEYKAWYRFNIHNLVGQIQNAINNHNGDYNKFKKELVILDTVRNQSYKDYIDPLLINHLEKIN